MDIKQRNIQWPEEIELARMMSPEAHDLITRMI